VLIVLASSHDAGAASLVRRWRPHGARLLTCADLSRPGWRWEPDAPGRATYVVAGDPVPSRAVRGAVSLLAAVGPAELPHIVAEEQEYVASEMTAFLMAWLSSLPCRMINRPTPLCLTGPRLAHEQWLRLAVHLDLPIRPSLRRVRPFASHGPGDPSSSLGGETPEGEGGRLVPVPIVAGLCVTAGLGELPPTEFLARLSRLAAEAGAGLLTATLEQQQHGWRFIGATPMVDVTRSDVTDAMLQALGVSP
jgi:hypothetical protein